MNSFLIRVELNGSPGPDVYQRLHERLLARNVYRRVLSTDGYWYDLPNATYYAEWNLDVERVRDIIVADAETVWNSVDVIVALSPAAAWQLNPSATAEPC